MTVLNAILLFALLSPLPANATMLQFNTLMGAVPGGKFKYRCQTCHDVGARRNSFGRSFEKFFLPVGNDPDFATISKMSEKEKWQALLSLDSDLDGVSNLDEILSGTNPGVSGK